MIIDPNKSTTYYLQAFDKLDTSGEHTFNNAAAYLGCLWMLYRKMYLYAILALVFQMIMTVILGIVGKKLTFFGDAETGQYIGHVISIIVSIKLFGNYGNSLYYRDIKSRIAKGYHVAYDYQATALPLAILFSVMRASTAAMPILLIPIISLVAWFFHYKDSALLTQQPNYDIIIRPDLVQQYLNRGSTGSSYMQSTNYCVYFLSSVAAIFTAIKLFDNPSIAKIIVTVLNMILTVIV